LRQGPTNRQIPIGGHPSPPTPLRPAVSSLGGFRTPAQACGPVELSQPQGAQERSRRRNAAPFVLPLVRTSENDRKRRARGRPPRHTVADVGCVRVLC
jgi:hypothetical protein